MARLSRGGPMSLLGNYRVEAAHHQQSSRPPPLRSRIRNSHHHLSRPHHLSILVIYTHPPQRSPPSASPPSPSHPPHHILQHHHHHHLKLFSPSPARILGASCSLRRSLQSWHLSITKKVHLFLQQTRLVSSYFPFAGFTSFSRIQEEHRHQSGEFQ
ncbi:hypothetical protein BZA77DRAFT_309069 [Pyronema omphalodes]|nr:hypothetical protein BZA77DRAFT_309069 [Pyronema omphalodes]